MNPLPTSDVWTSVAEPALTASFLIVMMFSLGLELGAQPRKTKETKRHERRLIVRALVLNLVVLPLIAFALVRGMHRSGVVAAAVLLAAATPGGRFAPHLAKVARGDLGLAVEITLFLAKLTAFTAPVTIKWLLGVPRIELHDLVLIAQLLLLQVLPYLVGRRLRRASPRLAERLARPLLALEAALGIAFFAVLLGRGALAGLRTVGPADWGAGFAFALLSLGSGWLAGGPEPEARRSFAVTAAARNLALGLLVASALFPGGSVQLALLGIWLMCLAVDTVFAAAIRGPRPSPQLAS
jgi:BASS family bile acid:Na+ symporter